MRYYIAQVYEYTRREKNDRSYNELECMTSDLIIIVIIIVGLVPLDYCCCSRDCYTTAVLVFFSYTTTFK